MIVVCASLVKTGSTWWIQLANELLAHHGGADTAAVRESWHLGRLIRGDEYRIGSLRAHRMLAVAPAARFAPPFAVKTHAPATPSFDALCRLGLARATLNVRDPRDLAVSVADHAEKRRANPRNALRELRSVDDAIHYVAELEGVFESWQRRGVMVVRYEDLAADPAHEVGRLAELVGLDVDRAGAEAVVEAVRIASDSNPNLTKRNVGGAGRHLDVMTIAQRRRADELLEPLLLAMGYATD